MTEGHAYREDYTCAKPQVNSTQPLGMRAEVHLLLDLLCLATTHRYSTDPRPVAVSHDLLAKLLPLMILTRETHTDGHTGEESEMSRIASASRR